MSCIQKPDKNKTKPLPRSGIARIAPYKQGKSSVEGGANPVKLSSNESPLGPSPKALDAYRRAGEQLYRYADGGQTELREAIAKTFDLDAQRIVCGNGSDEVLQMVIRAYTGPEDEVIISQYAFAMCETHALAQGAKIIIAPEPDCRINVDNILERVTGKTRLITLATPNNPCGTFLPHDELTRLHDNLPSDIILLVDAAYADYVEDRDYDSGLALASTADNVVMTRTFSKLYGLASLRVGWGYGPSEIINVLHTIRTPFNVNGPAMAAAAAAVADRPYTAMVRTHNNRWLRIMTEQLSSMGLEVIPSVTNFILIRFPDEKFSAKKSWEFLLERGIIPRPVNAGGPDNCLRVSIGLDHENEAFLDALRLFMKAN